MCSAGFTLIELIIVLAIATLLLTLVTPLTFNSARTAELRAAARGLAADLRLLRQQAISSGKEIDLTVDVATPGRVSAPGLRRELPQDTAVSFRAGTNGEIAGTPVIRFLPDGTSSGGRIELRHGARTEAVSVSWPFGRVSYEE